MTDERFRAYFTQALMAAKSLVCFAMMDANPFDLAHLVVIVRPLRIREKIMQAHLEDMIVGRCPCLKTFARRTKIFHVNYPSTLLSLSFRIVHRLYRLFTFTNPGLTKLYDRAERGSGERNRASRNCK
jgi:hypothetical protein